MNISLQLFAAAKEIAETSELSISLPDGASVGDLRNAIVNQHPALAGLAAHSMFAIADDYVKDDTKLSDKTVVAMIPPVSGG